MLATEKKPASVQFSLGKSADVSHPMKLINATGSKMRITGKVRIPSDDEGDPEGYEPVPLFSKSFGDALAQALEQVEKVEEKTGKNVYSIQNIFTM